MEDSVTNLAKEITRKNSRQTYWTIYLLVDKAHKEDCYKAYAYFRWLDDQIDSELQSLKERHEFIIKQKNLINDCYNNINVKTDTPEEALIKSLIQNDPHNPKLQKFISNFLAIIEFDAKRKNHRIIRNDLIWYTQTLGEAVTNCIENYINPNEIIPDSPYHYQAATAAHITHILRDCKEDISQGYFNIPKEDIQNPHEINQTWVKDQVKQAQTYFKNGKKYIYSLPSFKLKLVALWYCDRFEWMLKTIESDNYVLREQYYQKKHFKNLYYYLKTLILLTIRHTVKL